jgi:hypothetical protein
VLILPFHSITSVRDPSIYTSIIRQITARTTSQLLIYFHGSALLGHGEAQVTWFDVQRFLSIIYSASSQEAVKHDRVLMDVDVLIEGFAVDPTGRRDKGAHGMVGGKWDRVWVSENEEDGGEFAILSIYHPALEVSDGFHVGRPSDRRGPRQASCMPATSP